MHSSGNRGQDEQCMRISFRIWPRRRRDDPELILPLTMTSHRMSTITPSPINARTVLDIKELLEGIFRSENLSKSDLLRLCLVSRAWNDVPERVLWGELSDLRPLFSLLPADAIPVVSGNA